jgi:hypothetical protein
MAGGVSTDDIESDTSPHAETLARSDEEPSPADLAHFESSEEAPVAFEEEVGSESEEFLREAFADLAEEDVQAGSEDDWIEALGTYDNNNQPPDWLYEAVGFTGESELPDDYDLPEWLSEPSSLGENDIVEESSAGDSPEAIGDDPTRAQETDRPEKSSLTDEFGYENLDDVEAQLGADFGEGGRSEWPDEDTILGEPFQHGDSSEEDRTTETRKVGGGIDWLSELAAAPSGPDEEGDQTDQTPRSEESEFEASDQVPDWLQRHITEDNSRTDPNEGTFSQNYDQEIEIDDDNDLDPDQDNDLSD